MPTSPKFVANSPRRFKPALSTRKPNRLSGSVFQKRILYRALKSPKLLHAVKNNNSDNAKTSTTDKAPETSISYDRNNPSHKLEHQMALFETLKNYDRGYHGVDNFFDECNAIACGLPTQGYMVMTFQQFHAMAITAMRTCVRCSYGTWDLVFYPKNKFVVFEPSPLAVVAIDCVAMGKSMPYFKWKFNGLTAEEWLNVDAAVMKEPEATRPRFVALAFDDYERTTAHFLFYFRETQMTCSMPCRVGGGRYWHESSARPYELSMRFNDEMIAAFRKTCKESKSRYPIEANSRKEVRLAGRNDGIFLDWTFHSRHFGLNSDFKQSDCLFEYVETIKELVDDYHATC